MSSVTTRPVFDFNTTDAELHENVFVLRSLIEAGKYAHPSELQKYERRYQEFLDSFNLGLVAYTRAERNGSQLSVSIDPARFKKGDPSRLAALANLLLIAQGRDDLTFGIKDRPDTTYILFRGYGDITLIVENGNKQFSPHTPDICLQGQLDGVISFLTQSI